MKQPSIIPPNLNWLFVGPDAKGNPTAEYAIDGQYVYERTPTESGYSYRRCPWPKVIESTSLLDQPLGIWEPIDV
jgi:hypothetical protein